MAAKFAYIIHDDRLSARVSDTERCAGKRANYHVYYTTKRGARRFDPSWADTPQEAADQIAGFLSGAYALKVVSLFQGVMV
jgi:hypothetical protein